VEVACNWFSAHGLMCTILVMLKISNVVIVLVCCEH